MPTDSEYSGIERRHHQRVVFNGSAKLHVQGFEPVQVRTRNISVGGLGLVTSVNVATGAACIVSIVIPDGGEQVTATLRARVVNGMFNPIEDGYMLGLSFVSLPAKIAATIARFMKSR